MDWETIREERAEQVVIIRLNRPESFNAFDFLMGEELLRAMERNGGDERVRAMILTGSGRAFCSGGDIRAMKAFLRKGEEPPARFFEGLTRLLHGIVVEMQRCPKPIVAAVNGAAAGAGFSLALACDIRVAAQSATFTQAYTRIGLVPDGGSTYFLPRFVGPGRAADLIFLNPVLTAQEALQWGIVSRVAADEALEETALSLAGQLARGPTRAFAAAKELLMGSWAGSLEAQLEEERRRIMACSMSEDFREGIEAFLAKRSARFSGK